MRFAKYVGVGLLLVLGSPPLLLLLVLLGVGGLCAVLVEHYGRVTYRFTHAGETILVCTRRHGWNEFLLNNVAPVLPTDSVMFWSGTEEQQWMQRAVVRAVRGVPRPFLIRVRRLRNQIVPLHDLLLPLKSHAKRSAETQNAVRELLQLR